MKSYKLWICAALMGLPAGDAFAQEAKLALLEAAGAEVKEAILSTAIEPGWPNSISCGGQILNINAVAEEEVEYAWCWSYDCLTVSFDRESGDARPWRVVDLDGLQPFEERIYNGCANGSTNMSDLSGRGLTDLLYLGDSDD
ncbi:MAG TPA: hypothetical protein VKY54_06375 [Kiloniellales bacterium]|nr:hypothetical protein [Kiloniellales bacterium]